MEIRFADEEMKECFDDAQNASRYLGAKVAERFAYVLNFIGCIDSASDLQSFAFLGAVAPTGVGESWTVSLDERWRLVLQPMDEGKAIKIMEVVS